MIRLLNQKDKDLVLKYLNKHDIETTFLIGNVNLFGLDNDKNVRRCGDYYGYFENGTLRGVLPFYNLGSCIPHYDSPSAIPYFAELLKENNFEFLLGMESVIKPLYEEIKDLKVTKEYSEDSYYINDSFKPFTLENITIKEAGCQDIDMVKFHLRGRIEGFHQQSTIEDVARMFEQKPQEEDFIFLLKDNVISAEGCVQTVTDKIEQIGSVFTAPEARGNGYCKAVVSELCRRIISKGKIPTLMVTKTNTPAVKAYSSLGFKHYDNYLIISFKI